MNEAAIAAFGRTARLGGMSSGVRTARRSAIAFQKKNAVYTISFAPSPKRCAGFSAERSYQP
uniref:Uncharacterized protein n=1 Tax=Rhizobium leguminosarum TaxID=384 RepID=A0A179BFU7_RHILE|nr:hypothetical protein A4U53_29185 [Rhizobium leguminosarum]